MDAFEIMVDLKRRRDAILSLLTPDARADLAAIDARMRGIESVFTPKRKRLPIRLRREKLTDYLREHGPSSRPEIIAGTNLPVGTLSALLVDTTTFYSPCWGQWDLRPASNDTSP